MSANTSILYTKWVDEQQRDRVSPNFLTIRFNEALILTTRERTGMHSSFKFSLLQINCTRHSFKSELQISMWRGQDPLNLSKQGSKGYIFRMWLVTSEIVVIIMQLANKEDNKARDRIIMMETRQKASLNRPTRYYFDLEL